jgi:hypothetical protein
VLQLAFNMGLQHRGGRAELAPHTLLFVAEPSGLGHEVHLTPD